MRDRQIEIVTTVCGLIVLLSMAVTLTLIARNIHRLDFQVRAHRAALDAALERERDLTQKLRAVPVLKCPSITASADLGIKVEAGRPLCDATYSVPKTGRVLMRPGATAVVSPYAEGCEKGSK